MLLKIGLHGCVPTPARKRGTPSSQCTKHNCALGEGPGAGERVRAMDAWPPPPPFWKLHAADSTHAPPAPPRVPDGAEEALLMYGARYSTSLSLPTLRDAGMPQLFDASTSVADFRRLNESLLVHYVDLVRGMRRGDNQDARLEAMEKVFVNMHFLINSRRPAQAEAALAATISAQVARQREWTRQLEEACDEAEALLRKHESKSKRRRPDEQD